MTRAGTLQAAANEEQRSASRGGRLAFGPLVIAALAVGIAVQLQDGEYTPLATALVTIALGGGIAAVGGMFAVSGLSPLSLRERVRVRAHCDRSPSASPHPNPGEGEKRGTHRLAALLLAGLAVEFALLFTRWPGVDLPHRVDRQMVPFRAGVATAGVLVAVSVLVNSNPLRRAWFPLLLITHLLLGIWMVHSSPHPQIDVWVFQQNGAAELLKGHNPYAITYPDIYHSTFPGHQQVYGTGLVANDRLQFGFPYPPISLLLATIGYAVAGDHRYAQAVALVLAGLFIGYSRPGRVAKLAAALLLFTPRVFFVLGRGWTEPFGIMLLAATIFCACRRWRLLPLALGLFLATKQYTILAVPLTFFLLPTGWSWRDWFNLLWKAALVAAAVTLPLALWNWRAFWHSTVAVQELAPFRWDALSYLVWYGLARAHFHALDYPIWFVSRRLTVTDSITAVIWSVSAATAMLALSLWRSPRNPAGFAASLALISLAFFAFNKQAFCNYYFFVVGALCCAIAACGAEWTGTRPQRE